MQLLYDELCATTDEPVMHDRDARLGSFHA
jgi:hypothetical protein